MHWSGSSGNGLLDRIARFVPTLRESHSRLSVPAGTLLYGPGDSMPHLFFPAGGVLVTLVSEHRGDSAEAWSTGREGVAPVFALLGVRRSPLILMQQVPGDLIRVPVAPLLRAMRERDNVRALLQGYLAYSLRASSQATACNALHSALSRTARALLTTADRAHTDKFDLTQAMLAGMLGTPRQTINVAMRELVRRQLVRVRRGQVQLLNRLALERVSCTCYSLMSGRHWEQA